MRKLVVLLSLVLAVALAAPAYAAITPQFSLEGEANFLMMYAQEPEDPRNYSFFGWVTKLYSKLTIAGHTVGGDGSPKASFSFGVVAENKEEPDWKAGAKPNFGSGAFSQDNVAMNLRISDVLFTFEGAYWKNGPVVTTEIGNRPTYWSKYIAGEKDTSEAGTADTFSAKGDGIVISGFGVGPFDTRLGFIVVNPERRYFITNWDGQLDAVDVEFTTLTHTGPGFSSGSGVGIGSAKHDLHLGVGLTPVDGLEIKANYASDGLNNGYVYDLNASLSTIPNVTVNAGVRGIDPNGAFNPTYANRDKDPDECKDNKFDLCAHDSRSGFHVEVRTTQAGINLGLRHDQGTHPTDDAYSRTITKFDAGTVISDFEVKGAVTLTDKVNDDDDSTKLEASVKKSFGSINASYSFSHETKKGAPNDPTIVHTIAADTTIDTPLADGVKLSGQVKLHNKENDGNPQVHTSAEWTAPMGLKLGLHYANYNRKDHGAVPNGDPLSKPEGFYATAEYGVKF